MDFPLSGQELNNLAYEYSHSLEGPIELHYYADANQWFKQKTQYTSQNSHYAAKDYSLFIDLVHMWTKNTTNLNLDDAYCSFPEFCEIEN